MEPESDLGSGRSTDFGSVGSSGYNIIIEHNTQYHYTCVVSRNFDQLLGIDRSEIIGNVMTTMGDNHNHIER